MSHFRPAKTPKLFVHPVHDIAKQAEQLAELTNQAREFVRLDLFLQRQLPYRLQGECRAVCVNAAGNLVVFAYQSGVAAKLRALERQILQAFADRGYDFPRMDVLRRARFERITPAPNVRPISAAARANLRAGAAAIDDPKLRAALLRLASDET